MGEEESNLETYASKFSYIKKEGKPCPIEEARKFYVMALKQRQEDFRNVCNEMGENLNQNISYYLLSTESYNVINDSLEAIVEQTSIYSELLNMVKALYKNKSEYNAYVLEEKIVMEVEGEEKECVRKQYFIESKEFKDKRKEDIYIYEQSA